jgi:hypothetical protein
MDEAATRFTLTTLQKKRASLAGEIDDFKRKIAHRETALAHVDAVLRLLAPDANPATIPSRRPRRVKLFRQGQLGRMILGILRKAEGPLSTDAIVARIISENRLPSEARKALGARVRSNLAYQAKIGRVAKSDSGTKARWSANKRFRPEIKHAA